MPRNRTILLGLDGATFSILDPMMEEGVMPRLKEFTASGVRATLRSVIPPLTPPAWTSIMTGRSPGNHGVFDFLRFESPDTRYMTFNNSRHNKCETIWSILSRQGLKSASLNFVMMAPVRPVSGYVIPGWVPWRLMPRQFYPARLYSRVKALPGFNLRELAMDVSSDEKAIEGCFTEDYEEWIKFHTRREKQWFEIFRYLMQDDSCCLMAIVFDGVDKLQHLCWRLLDPSLVPQQPSAWEQRIHNLCLDYFRQLDQFIAEAISMAGQESNVFIVSDHGFTGTSVIFYINAWLRQHGYLEWADGSPLTRTPSNRFGAEAPLKQAYSLDWAKTKAYGLTSGSNGIHICVAGQRGDQGILPEDYERFRQKLMESLHSFIDTATGIPVIANIYPREEIFTGSQSHDAPDLTLTLMDSGFVSLLKSEVLLEPRPEPVGTHHPDGIFIAAGSGIRKGDCASPVSILDITPALLYSLGLPIPEDLEGHVPIEVFQPSLLREQPVCIGEPTQPPQPFPPHPTEESVEEQAEILAKLRMLGYM